MNRAKPQGSMRRRAGGTSDTELQFLLADGVGDLTPRAQYSGWNHG